MLLRYHITRTISRLLWWGSAPEEGLRQMAARTHVAHLMLFATYQLAGRGADCVSQLSWQMKVTSETIDIPPR